MKYVKKFDLFESKSESLKEIKDIIIKLGRKEGLKFKDVDSDEYDLYLNFEEDTDDYINNYFFKLKDYSKKTFEFEYGCASWSKSRRHGELSGDSGMSKFNLECTLDDCKSKISKAIDKIK